MCSSLKFPKSAGKSSLTSGHDQSAAVIKQVTGRMVCFDTFAVRIICRDVMVTHETWVKIREKIREKISSNTRCFAPSRHNLTYSDQC